MLMIAVFILMLLFSDVIDVGDHVDVFVSDVVDGDDQ